MNLDKITQNLEQLWEGDFPDVDIKTVKDSMKVLKILMPILQNVQIQRITPVDQPAVYLLQVVNALQLDELSYEVIRDFVIQQTGYRRPTAETVGPEKQEAVKKEEKTNQNINK